MTKPIVPVRQFRCRLEELGPLSGLVRQQFDANQAAFGKASPDYLTPAFTKAWEVDAAGFEKLVPIGVRQATDKDVTRAMTAVATGLREPLNWLNIRLNRAAAKGTLPGAVADFGLTKVRSEITTRDMEGLDGALKHLLDTLALPGSAAALTAQGHTPADTQALVTARQQIAAFNTAQNANLNTSIALTADNIAAGNALWVHVADVLETGKLLYKESNPRKARTFAMAGLLKRVRHEQGGGAAPAPGA